MTGVHNKLRVNVSLVIMESETVTCWNMTLGGSRYSSLHRERNSMLASLLIDSYIAHATVTDQANILPD